MKLSEELKIKRAEKVARMQAILDARKENGTLRAATTEETTEYDGLKAEVARMDTDITEAEGLEAREIEQPQNRSFNIGGKAKPYNVAKAIREYANSGGSQGLTGLELESHQEMARGIESTGLLVPYSMRDQNTTSNADSIDVKIVPGISIIGKEPLYQQMGLTVLNGLTGSLKIGKKTPDVAGTYAEKSAITQTAAVPTFEDMSPEAVGMTDIFTKELLAQENPQVHLAIINDMVKGIDRKYTGIAYTTALAAATEVTAGALTPAGFNALMAAVDTDGAFAMARSTFFEGKGVDITGGEVGKFLLEMQGSNNGVGRSFDGVNAYYSTLFADGAAKKYVVYGAWGEIWVGFWGALEILVNPYTYQKTRQIELTVNKLGKMVCRNDAAFVKSPDLDSAT